MKPPTRSRPSPPGISPSPCGCRRKSSRRVPAATRYSTVPGNETRRSSLQRASADNVARRHRRIRRFPGGAGRVVTEPELGANPGSLRTGASSRSTRPGRACAAGRGGRTGEGGLDEEGGHPRNLLQHRLPVDSRIVPSSTRVRSLTQWRGHSSVPARADASPFTPSARMPKSPQTRSGRVRHRPYLRVSALSGAWAGLRGSRSGCGGETAAGQQFLPATKQARQRGQLPRMSQRWSQPPRGSATRRRTRRRRAGSRASRAPRR